MHLSCWSASQAPHSNKKHPPTLPPPWQFHTWLPVKFTNTQASSVCVFRSASSDTANRGCNREDWSVAHWCGLWREQPCKHSCHLEQHAPMCVMHKLPLALIKFLTNVPLGRCRGCFGAETLCGLAFQSVSLWDLNSGCCKTLVWLGKNAFWPNFILIISTIRCQSRNISLFDGQTQPLCWWWEAVLLHKRKRTMSNFVLSALRR